MKIISRRTVVGFGMAAFTAACSKRKGTGYPGYALIAAAGERALAVVDLTEFRHIKDVDLGAEPTAVMAGAAGHVYILTPQTGSIHELTPDLQRGATYRWAESLSGAAVSDGAKYVTAISSVTREWLVADSQSLQVKNRFKIEADPKYLAIGASDYAAVSTGAGGSIELLNLGSGQRWRRQMRGEMGKLVFRNDGQLLLAANLHDRSLTALSIPALEIVAELPLAMKPDNLCFGAGGGQLFISGAGMDGIAIVFPYRVLQVDQTILAGRDPGVMAVSEVPGYLFVGSASGSDVCVMDIDNRRVIGLVDVGQQPGFITVTPDNQYALVLNEKSGDMAVIHVSTIRQNFEASSHKSGASLFTMLPVGERPVHAIVVPRIA